MKDILDFEPKPKIKRRAQFSAMGLGLAIINPMMFFLSPTITVGNKVMNTFVSIQLDLLFAFLGLILSLIGLIRKEEGKYITPIAAGLNLLWFILLAVYGIYTYS